MDQSQTPQAGTPTAATSSELHTQLAARLADGLPGLLGLELVEARPGALALQVTIRPQHMAANGFLHAGTVVTLADTACGFGCMASLPDGAQSFTTIELKCNFMRTTLAGRLQATAILVHGGRRTQVWDATVVDEQERTIALFRCTQMLLYPG